ncbi:unnamed protein product [Brassicogethes aeneus]|uniref:Uncharacterized protein n=1 Tax=Brassicogethes aeneus TaxID=1431903 RepID=A0A9P0B5W3_BRAAE|nr:unnamed protein product [Brassicogethes aeneus]
MLLRVLLITVLIYLCQCRPLDSDADAKIVKYENDVRPDGYKFESTTSFGMPGTESWDMNEDHGKVHYFNQGLIATESLVGTGLG